MSRKNKTEAPFHGHNWMAMAVAVLFLSTAAWASTEKVLLNFHGTDGAAPANLIFDSAGNLFGVATAGGTGPCSGGCGTIFELKATSGGWVTSVVHDFQGGADGADPVVGVILDAAGNIYGATTWGSGGGCNHGCGTVFELSRGAGGEWTKKTLYRFTVSAGSGYYPNGTLTMDASGNLYGTATDGGPSGYGTVFELSPTTSGPWTLTVLHAFTGTPDAKYPLTGVVFDANGNLFGTAVGGHGAVFELSSSSGSGWTEDVIYTFLGGPDGSDPNGGIVLDAAGNVYGTTNQGGNNAFLQGTVFEISPVASGGWSKRTIYDFEGYPFGTDGTNPNYMTPILDAAGNLYGTNYEGATGNLGAVFELSPSTSGMWTYNILLQFGVSNPGWSPISSVIFDSAGNLYGTTVTGGTHEDGLVFELTP
jgi:uncharacterized repeat protein (TIGR03803 family)